MGNTEKFARRCDVTNKGMNSGWYDENSTEHQYFKDREVVIAHIQSALIQDTQLIEDLNLDVKNESFDRLFDVAYNHLGIYWEEWKVEKGENYFNEFGTEFVQCHKCGCYTEIIESFNFCTHCLTHL